MNALISVIICTYQGERFLEAALQSIADQQDAALEVIAIDDGSTDCTLEILRQFADRLPLKIIAGKRTGNWIVNTNRGLREARGDYIGFLHQDDLWAPGRLQALRKMIADFPDCSLFVHPSDYIDDAGRKVGCWSLPFPRRRQQIASGDFLERLLVQNLLAIPAPLFSRKLVQKAGTLREDLWFLADWEYWGRLAALSPAGICPDCLASFRIHKDSQTSTRSYDADDMRRQYHTVIDAIAGKCHQVSPKRLERARRAALLNCEVSIMLAQLSHGARPEYSRVLKTAARLSPPAWQRFLRDSRIIPRLTSRLRVRFGKPAA